MDVYALLICHRDNFRIVKVFFFLFHFLYIIALHFFLEFFPVSFFFLFLISTKKKRRNKRKKTILFFYGTRNQHYLTFSGMWLYKYDYFYSKNIYVLKRMILFCATIFFLILSFFNSKAPKWLLFLLLSPHQSC